MERDLWRAIVAAIRRVPRRRPRNAAYDNRSILAVYMWSVLHDRPVSWACRRSNWPASAWRDPAVRGDLRALLERLQRDLPESSLRIIDGKALPLGVHGRDPDSANGWASRGYARGYKLHALIDASQRVVAFDVRPLNTSEKTVARELIDAAGGRRGATLLGDSAYDSNPLYAACAERGVRLLAPRRTPNRGFSTGHKQHPARLAAARLIEGHDPPAVLGERGRIERFFARLAVGSRLYALPPWVRRAHRVWAWVAGKLACNAARIALARAVHA